MSDYCPVCGFADSVGIDYRAAVPILMNRLYRTQAAASAAKRGILDLHSCKACGFVWNRAFDSSLVVYDQAYENDQSCSHVFLDHVKARAAEVVNAVRDGEPVDFLEIGCGQGGFISEIALAAGGRLRSLEGFDPVWRGKDGEGPHGSRIHKTYFDAPGAQRLLNRPNVVATRHTIEHVPEPVVFLATIREALGRDSRARLFVETPCVEWILRHEAMQDFFYEHCSLFTAQSLRYAMERARFRVIRIDHVFGGQYLWAEAEAGVDVLAHPPAKAELGELAGSRMRFANRWRRVIESARTSGPVAIWGAGAKGVTFALLVDQESSLIDHAVDINPQKQDCYLAGTHLKVLSPQESAGRSPKTILVMNPNYTAEVEVIAANVGIKAQLIPVD